MVFFDQAPRAAPSLRYKRPRRPLANGGRAARVLCPDDGSARREGVGRRAGGLRPRRGRAGSRAGGAAPFGLQGQLAASIPRLLLVVAVNTWSVQAPGPTDGPSGTALSFG